MYPPYREGRFNVSDRPCQIDGWYEWYELAFDMFTYWRKEYPDYEVYLITRAQGGKKVRLGKHHYVVKDIQRHKRPEQAVVRV
jgi:hypothetical protein